MTERQKLILELVRLARHQHRMKGWDGQWVGHTKVTDEMREYAAIAYMFSAQMASWKLFGRALKTRY